MHEERGALEVVGHDLGHLGLPWVGGLVTAPVDEEQLRGPGLGTRFLGGPLASSTRRCPALPAVALFFASCLNCELAEVLTDSASWS